MRKHLHHDYSRELTLTNSTVLLIAATVTVSIVLSWLVLTNCTVSGNNVNDRSAGTLVYPADPN